jgi:AraC-like DNA-binding protein
VSGGACQLDERLVERLKALIEVERVHLDPTLTFATFVRRMGASERAVRQLINRELGHDHFRAFLNACRMAEARRLLADPRRSQDKLIALALDSGFASLASFNRVFRACQGCTPSQYREASLPGAPASPCAPDSPIMAPHPPFEERSAAFWEAGTSGASYR